MGPVFDGLGCVAGRTGRGRRARARALALGAVLALSAALAAVAQAGPIAPVTTFSALQSAVASGGTVQLGANIDASTGGNLVVGSNPVTLDLNGYSLKVTSTTSAVAAIEVPSGDSLTIEDTSISGAGSLTAVGGPYAAGIGGNGNTGGTGETAGSITISGGTVSATGGTGGTGGGATPYNSGAGIGGGSGSTTGGAGGTVTISGGTVTATGGIGAAGLGGGSGTSTGGDGGAVTVSGGAVTATGGDGAAGIGGGSSNTATQVGGAGATVDLTGGTVTAKGGSGAPGVGAGVCQASCPPLNDGKLQIDLGGTLTASGGSTAPSAVGNPADNTLILTNLGKLIIPAGQILDLGIENLANFGVIDIEGWLQGAASLDNKGTIEGSGFVSSLLAGGTLDVQSNSYKLAFSVNGGLSSAPPSQYVYAPTVAAAGQSLPAGPTPPSASNPFLGWFTATSGIQVTDTTDLPSLFGGGPLVESLYAQYYEPVAMVSSPQAATVTAGQTATFTASAAAGDPAPSVQWQVSTDGGASFTNIGAATSDTLTLTGATVAQSGNQYRAVFSNAFGGSSSSVPTSPATLTVNPIAQTIVAAPLGASATVGSSATLAATGGGSGQPVLFSVDAATAPANACTVTQTGSGSGTVTYAHAGTCVIDVNQAASADGNYAAAPTVTQSVTVVAQPSTVTLSAPGVTASGQGATLTATVTEPDGSVPGGTVQFTVDGSAVGSPIPVVAGQAVSSAIAAGLAPGSHSIGAVFTPADLSVYRSASAQAVPLTVDQAASGVSLHVGSGSLTATVKPVAPGAGVPSGTVTFSVDGRTVGSAALAGGVATLTLTLGHGVHRVAAVYSGDADFTGSSASTAGGNPIIVAQVISPGRRSAAGWYRAPVRIGFVCRSAPARLVNGCPEPVTLSRDGGGQSVTRTIHASDGGVATVSVRGINIDRQAPIVRVAGVRPGAAFTGTGPTVRCAATDRLSGVASCVLSRQVTHDRATGVATVTVTATATDRAGNRAGARVSYETLGSYLVGVPYRDGAFQVALGHTYTLVVSTAGPAPRYLAAGLAPRGPGGLDTPFYPDGHGRWYIGVTFTPRMAVHRVWQIGIRYGGVVHVLTVHTR